MESSWFVIRTFPRSEGFVQKALTEKSFLAYAPTQKQFARFARRKAIQTRPLIPGYCFACLPDDVAISEAYAIRGVLGLLSSQGRPQPIPAEIVGALVLAEACHQFDSTWRPAEAGKRRYSHRWRSGERVEIVQGPARGWVGSVSRAYGRRWLEVILGACQVVVDQRHVLPVQGVAEQQAA